MASQKVVNLRKLQKKLRDRSVQLAIPRKIGFSKEEQQIVKKPNLRDITRNRSEQIVSYTLPQPKLAENTKDKTTTLQYGKVSLPATKNKFNRIEYFRTIDTDIETYTREIQDYNNTITELNALSFPLGDAGDDGFDGNRLNFSGEIVRVGSGPTTYFYIEDGVFYTMAGLFSLLAEKLGKPLGFRINDDYDYTDEYKPAKAPMIDMGQNQYSIYNKLTYTRNSIAYVESNTFGGALTKRMVLGSAAADVILLEYTIGPEVDNNCTEIKIYGHDSTPVTYKYFFETVPASSAIRKSITSTENDLKAKFIFNSKNGDDASSQFEFILKYTDGSTEKIRKTPNSKNSFKAGSKKEITISNSEYIIPKELITEKLSKIDIKFFDGYAPFGDAGTDGEYRWESITTKVIKQRNRDKVRGVLSKLKSKVRRRGLLGRLFGRF